jgi:hypothetical protein
MLQSFGRRLRNGGPPSLQNSATVPGGDIAHRGLRRLVRTNPRRQYETVVSSSSLSCHDERRIRGRQGVSAQGYVVGRPTRTWIRSSVIVVISSMSFLLFGLVASPARAAEKTCESANPRRVKTELLVRPSDQPALALTGNTTVEVPTTWSVVNNVRRGRNREFASALRCLLVGPKASRDELRYERRDGLPRLSADAKWARIEDTATGVLFLSERRPFYTALAVWSIRATGNNVRFSLNPPNSMKRGSWEITLDIRGF